MPSPGLCCYASPSVNKCRYLPRPRPPRLPVFLNLQLSNHFPFTTTLRNISGDRAQFAPSRRKTRVSVRISIIVLGGKRWRETADDPQVGDVPDLSFANTSNFSICSYSREKRTCLPLLCNNQESTDGPGLPYESPALFPCSPP